MVFSTFVAQNFGAKKAERIKEGIKKAFISVAFFCVAISAVVCIFAEPMMSAFVGADKKAIIEVGMTYLRMEGACYIGIRYYLKRHSFTE